MRSFLTIAAVLGLLGAELEPYLPSSTAQGRGAQSSTLRIICIGTASIARSKNAGRM
jgi:hypothetical protein